MKTFGWTLLLTLIVPAPLSAANPEPEPGSSRVAYDDLDLTRPEDRATLDRRLRQAARRVCQDHVILTPLAPHALARCEREALADANQSVLAAVAQAEARPRLPAREDGH